jgi:hypothetical protein
VIDRLLGDLRAAITFTDPPYNVDLGNHGGRRPEPAGAEWPTNPSGDGSFAG